MPRRFELEQRRASSEDSTTRHRFLMDPDSAQRHKITEREGEDERPRRNGEHANDVCMLGWNGGCWEQGYRALVTSGWRRGRHTSSTTLFPRRP
jgi:hypothetical protein